MILARRLACTHKHSGLVTRPNLLLSFFNQRVNNDKIQLYPFIYSYTKIHIKRDGPTNKNTHTTRGASLKPPFLLTLFDYFSLLLELLVPEPVEFSVGSAIGVLESGEDEHLRLIHSG